MIEESTLQMVPEKIARTFCVLPQAVNANSITLYCPDDAQFRIEHEETIRFALNRTIEWIPVPRSVLDPTIEKYFRDQKPRFELQYSLPIQLSAKMGFIDSDS